MPSTAANDLRETPRGRAAWLAAGAAALIAFSLSVAASAPFAGDSATYYVDSARGDDANPGTESQPWKTVERASQAADSLAPGGAILFRRGAKWSKGALNVRGVKGTEQRPIVIGAYGPPDEPRPHIEGCKIAIADSEHIEVRDLEMSHSTSGGCLSADRSGYLTVYNNIVHDCASNGIVYHAAVHHTATVQNVVYNIQANDGISIHDVNWIDPPQPVGSHHWVIDNIMPGNYREDAIDAATNDWPGGQPAGEDIKIINNRCYGARLSGIVVGHEARRVWVIGNTISRCGQTGSMALKLGNETNLALVHVSGNLLVDNVRGVQIRGGSGRFERNTVIHREPGRIPVMIDKNADGLAILGNLILTAGAGWIQIDDGLDKRDAIRMDGNWYGFLPQANDAPQRLTHNGAHDLAAWREGFGWDAHSEFGPVPGIEMPGEIEPDPTKWDQDFLAAFVPAPQWPGFAMETGPAGAFGRGGERLGMDIQPFEDYEENGGYGWPGPKIVRERHPLPR
ncbi:MAG: hypothetical protein BWZ10_01450 [candidate division BRC1 bacterium ADurb.BinA364]|nr:MAG: hypothetical protein BWZ10_01450 [candidate division BRC1 bacterium ADurb.BinA364]